MGGLISARGLPGEFLRVPISGPDADDLGGVLLPRPRLWRHLIEYEPLMTVLLHPDGRKVMLSVTEEADRRRWIHLSLSRSDRLPSYEDLTGAKRDFLGPARKAIQVFPPEAEWINDHPFCLHLWSCLDGDPLPDFTRGNGTI